MDVASRVQLLLETSLRHGAFEEACVTGAPRPRQPGAPLVYPRSGPRECHGRDRGSGSARLMASSAFPALTDEMPEARKKPIVFVELDTRHNDGYTVSLEWNRDTGNTRIVVADSRDESLLVFPVPGANAGDAFRHPFRYAP
jgi:hypothetical protein